MTEIEPVPPAAPAALMLVEELWKAGALTVTHFNLGERTVPFDTFVSLGAWLGTVKRASSWWIGDWLAYGEHHYGERYVQAAHATGLTEETLMNIASIARRVPPSVRRENLPFHVHAEVAALPPREQDAWLAKAEEGGWTKAELRHQIKQDLTPALEPPPPDPSRVVEAARALIEAARRAGADYLVPAPSFHDLLAAMGQDFDA